MQSINYRIIRVKLMCHNYCFNIKATSLKNTSPAWKMFGIRWTTDFSSGTSMRERSTVS